MTLKKEEIGTLFNIINSYIISNNTSVYKLDKQGILSRKTLNKILKKDCSFLEEKTLKKILNFPNLDKESKEKIRQILKKSKSVSEKIITPKYDSNVIQDLLDKIILLEKENERIKENLENALKSPNKNTFSKSYNEKLKINSFKSDFDTTTKIIPLLWKLRDESFALFSELELLLEINSSSENIKMSKGLKKVGKDLIMMGEKIIKYSEESIIIDMEE